MEALKIKVREQENLENMSRIKVAKTVSAIDTSPTRIVKVFKVILAEARMDNNRPFF